ncbi:MAG: HAD-IC family P-type ATPase [bacterium]
MDFSQTAIKKIEEVFLATKSNKKGLTLKEVKDRQREGFNEITSHQITTVQILLRQFKSPFIYLLLGAALIAFGLKELIDGALIVLFVLISVSLGFYQEHRSEKAVKILKQFSRSKVHVWRAGKIDLIETKELVVGDVLLLQAGDKIPADVRFFETRDLTVDESILTGESVNIAKIADSLAKEPVDYYQAENIGFSGTSILSGSAKAVVFATGANSTFGKISQKVLETAKESNFERGISDFARFILRMVVVTMVLIFLLNIIIKGESAKIGELLIFSIALAVSVIPEALPLVTTISFSRGALRMARDKVVVRRLSAIEDLGSIEVLCTDKTGTITENKLTVSEIFGSRQTLFWAVTASSFLGERERQSNNSFDIALWQKLAKKEKGDLGDCQKLAEIPFDPGRRLSSSLIKTKDKKFLVAKGAPENIFKICQFQQFSEEKKNLAENLTELNNWVYQQGVAGKRVLAVAMKGAGAADKYEVKDETEMTLLGLISFIDPLKKDAKRAVNLAKKLGVEIKILTGDAKEVAGAVAYQIKLIEKPSQVITGEELSKLSPEEFKKVVEKEKVFARVSPEQKLKIIQTLQIKKIIGFLGEGFNDAPALKEANVALAVEGASDIARDVSDVILLNKSLTTIINGIVEGRKIFANTVKYIKSTLLSNFGNFYSIALISLIIDYLPMLPVQILLVNLLSDFPMIAITTDNVETEELRRPKNYNVRGIILIATILGLISTIFDFIFFGYFRRFGPQNLQTMWFMESILTELTVIFLIRTHGLFWRSKRPSNTLLGLSLAAALATIFIPFTKVGQKLFHFAQPKASYVITVLLMVGGYLLVTEIIKNLYYSSEKNHNFNN